MIMDTTPEMEPSEQTTGKRAHPFAALIRRPWIWFVIIICIATAAYLIFQMQTAARTGARAKAQNGAQRPIPVTALAAKKADVDVYLNGLGTVIPVYTIAVRSQVGGQLLRVHFKEGQVLKQGELLAEIDPRPFQVQLMQAEGQLARDEALLKNAEGDLVRYRQLLAQDSIAEQQVTTQESLVQQYRGAVKTDRGQIANANLQITYSRITAPVSGRVGLRQVDPGNMVQTNDANGLAVITQLQPITVVFSVPQENLPTVLKRLRTGTSPPVYAYSQDGKVLLATGRLHAVDNQIDTTTGTIKIKAMFENKKNELFPNQFVNVRMKVGTVNDATVIPTAATQRGSIGAFVYVVKPDKNVTVRAVRLGPTEGDDVAVAAGLSPGELVVTVGGDKLREGTKVEVAGDEAAGAPGQGKKAPREGSRKDKR
jgi:membrane fusion protein, multidrug efflux system